METLNKMNWTDAIKRLGKRLPMIVGTIAVFTFIIGLKLNVAGAINGLDLFAIFVLSIGLGLGAMMLRSAGKESDGKDRWYMTRYK